MIGIRSTQEKKLQKEELKELKARIFYYTGEKFEKAIREIGVKWKSLLLFHYLNKSILVF